MEPGIRDVMLGPDLWEGRMTGFMQIGRSTSMGHGDVTSLSSQRFQSPIKIPFPAAALGGARLAAPKRGRPIMRSLSLVPVPKQQR